MARKPQKDKSRKTGVGNTGSKKGLTSEDATLWAHISKHVTPQASNRFTGFEEIGRGAMAPKPASTADLFSKKTKKRMIAKLAPPSRLASEENSLFRETVIPSVRQNVPGLDRNTSEKLRRGRLEIEGRVDLHGHTRKEAHSRLRTFLASAHRQGKRCVLVITGKGSSVRQSDDAPFMSGSGKGILREEVPKWLAQSDLRRLVLDYRTAQAKHGGEGALYILLRRTRS